MCQMAVDVKISADMFIKSYACYLTIIHNDQYTTRGNSCFPIGLVIDDRMFYTLHAG